MLLMQKRKEQKMLLHRSSLRLYPHPARIIVPQIGVVGQGCNRPGCVHGGVAEIDPQLFHVRTVFDLVQSAVKPGGGAFIEP